MDKGQLAETYGGWIAITVKLFVKHGNSSGPVKSVQIPGQKAGEIVEPYNNFEEFCFQSNLYMAYNSWMNFYRIN